MTTDDSGSVQFNLQDSSGVFSIDSSGGLFVTSDGALLNFSVGDMLALQVEASDADGNVATAEVIVASLDPPTFDEPAYTFDVPEDSDEIGTVSATDSGSLSYNLIDNSGQFSIDASGAISAAGGSLVGYSGTSFDFQVDATNDAGITTSVNVSVNITAPPTRRSSTQNRMPLTYRKMPPA